MNQNQINRINLTIFYSYNLYDVNNTVSKMGYNIVNITIDEDKFHFDELDKILSKKVKTNCHYSDCTVIFTSINILDKSITIVTNQDKDDVSVIEDEFSNCIQEHLELKEQEKYFNEQKKILLSKYGIKFVSSYISLYKLILTGQYYDIISGINYSITKRLGVKEDDLNTEEAEKEKMKLIEIYQDWKKSSDKLKKLKGKL